MSCAGGVSYLGKSRWGQTGINVAAEIAMQAVKLVIIPIRGVWCILYGVFGWMESSDLCYLFALGKRLATLLPGTIFGPTRKQDCTSIKRNMIIPLFEFISVNTTLLSFHLIGSI